MHVSRINHWSQGDVNTKNIYVKVKVHPITGPEGPRGGVDL
jgi:hypothetical protein